MIANRMETDLASHSLEAANTTGADTLSTGTVLLDQLVGSEAANLKDLSIGESTSGVISNIELRDKDRLLIPTQSQVVTVIGETQQNTSHLFQAGLSRDGYIDRSGGLTRRADKK